MFSRRLLITGFAAAAASAIAPAVMAAGDGGFGDLLGGLADAASRRYAEKYRDDARWDGKYYYDKYATAVIPAANGSVKFKDVPALKKKDVIGATASVVPGKKNVTARTIASSRKNSVVMKKIAARMTAATPENVVAMNGIAETTNVAVTTVNPLLYG